MPLNSMCVKFSQILYGNNRQWFHHGLNPFIGGHHRENKDLAPLIIQIFWKRVFALIGNLILWCEHKLCWACRPYLKNVDCKHIMRILIEDLFYSAIPLWIYFDACSTLKLFPFSYHYIYPIPLWIHWTFLLNHPMMKDMTLQFI